MVETRVEQVRTLKLKAGQKTENSQLVSQIPRVVFQIVLALIDSPEQFEMKVTETGEVTKMLVKAAAADRGKVIGKRGKNAQAIRTILTAAGMKLHHGFGLEVAQGELEDAAPDSR